MYLAWGNHLVTSASNRGSTDRNDYEIIRNTCSGRVLDARGVWRFDGRDAGYAGDAFDQLAYQCSGSSAGCGASRTAFMKRAVAFLMVGGFLWTGCGSGETPTEPAGGSSSASGSSGQGYLGTVSKAKPMAQKTLAAAQLKQQIQAFYGEEGRFPKTLAELVPDYLPSLPTAPAGMKFDYNGATGDLSVVAQ